MLRSASSFDTYPLSSAFLRPPFLLFSQRFPLATRALPLQEQVVAFFSRIEGQGFVEQCFELGQERITGIKGIQPNPAKGSAEDDSPPFQEIELILIGARLDPKNTRA